MRGDLGSHQNACTKYAPALGHRDDRYPGHVVVVSVFGLTPVHLLMPRHTA